MIRNQPPLKPSTEFGTPPHAQADPVTFAKDAPLRAEPRFDAKPVAQISRGTTGEATAKQGGWLNIKTANASGWALTTDVSFGTAAASGGSSGSGGFSLFGRSQPSRTTTTVGIRGFDKETIGNAFDDRATVNTEQLALLDGYAVDKAGGQLFASAQGLKASSVSY